MPLAEKEQEKFVPTQEHLEEQHKCGVYFDDDYNYMQHLRDVKEGIFDDVDGDIEDDFVSIAGGLPQNERMTKPREVVDASDDYESDNTEVCDVCILYFTRGVLLVTKDVVPPCFFVEGIVRECDEMETVEKLLDTKGRLSRRALKKLNQATDLIDAMEEDDEINDDNESQCTNISTIRPKDETPEQRRLRKQAVREARRYRRQEKKLNKVAFADEHRKVCVIVLYSFSSSLINIRIFSMFSSLYFKLIFTINSNTLLFPIIILKLKSNFRLWEEHQYALLSFLGMVHKGIFGLVLDEKGKPVGNALIGVNNGKTINSTEAGEYWRILPPGQHMVYIFKACIDKVHAF
uniref:Protein LTV1 homolog n=1 Tax=Heterorhabditis bacteriophora TaxID=37862 RepID=A0A1I7WTD9_HETBA